MRYKEKLIELINSINDFNDLKIDGFSARVFILPKRLKIDLFTPDYQIREQCEFFKEDRGFDKFNEKSNKVIQKLLEISNGVK